MTVVTTTGCRMAANVWDFESEGSNEPSDAIYTARWCIRAGMYVQPAGSESLGSRRHYAATGHTAGARDCSNPPAADACHREEWTRHESCADLPRRRRDDPQGRRPVDHDRIPPRGCSLAAGERRLH